MLTQVFFQQNNMAYKNFAKYYPITEEEYHTFKELQRKQVKNIEEEMSRPDALHSLAATQNEKTRTIFNSTDNPDQQAQQISHLTTIIRGLKRQVDEQQQQQQQPQSQQQLPSIPPKQTTASNGMTRREKVLADALGDSIWTENGELVIDGNVIPNSKRAELLNYAGSKWTSKYLNKVPEGGVQLRNFLRERNIPQHLWNSRIFQNATQPSTSSEIQGLAIDVKTPRKKKITAPPPPPPARDKRVAAGLDILNSGQKFSKVMRKK